MVDQQHRGTGLVAELATAATYPSEGPEADLVMKGGITSGVVYPLAVCKLATEYRFRSVGGSSAGGIAAAFAAAAESARDTGGFQRLALLPLELGSALPRLFQPERSTRGLYALFTAVTSKGAGKAKRGMRGLAAAIRWHMAGTLCGVAVASALVALLFCAGDMPGSGYGWFGAGLAAAPFVVVFAALAAVGAAVVSALRNLPRNGHGLCIGSVGQGPEVDPAPFTDWIESKLRDVAATGDQVLTFGHLWGSQAVEAYYDAAPDDMKGREQALANADPRVRLEMMTTNVTQARPVRFPLTTDVYMYCPEELSRWFTPNVMAALAVGGEAFDDDAPLVCPEHAVPLRKLPHPPEFPVVVAVRMSLSFPILISAVPLWVVDFTLPEPRPVRCRFSDGGISSNFPIHFFDTLLPSRPTFAISLGPYPGADAADVYYPGNAGGFVPRARATESLPEFLGSILNTMQNWSDNGQSRLPGYRDRIVEVRTRPTEGGLNLDMDRTTILNLACRGYDAAAELLGKFDFPVHRRRRYSLAMAKLQDAVASIDAFYDIALPDGSPGYQAFVAELAGPGAVGRTDALLRFIGREPGPPPTRTAQTPDFTSSPPRPDPDLRIVARF